MMDATFVFVPGFLGRPDDWQPCLDALGAGLRTRLVDPFSDQDVGATDSLFERMVDRITDAAATANRPLVVGYSMGGRLALHAAMTRRVDWAGLVLLSTHPGLEDEQTRHERVLRDEAWGRRFETDTPTIVLKDWYAQPVFASLQANPTLAAELIQRRSDYVPAQASAVIRAASPGLVPSHWSRLGSLSMPVRWMAGGEDPVYVDVVRRAANLCTRGSHRIVPGVGHVLHLEAPGEVAHAIREFAEGEVT